MGATALLPLRRKACWGLFRPKNSTASVGCEPANLGTKGQHATSRPPITQFPLHFSFHYTYMKRGMVPGECTAWNCVYVCWRQLYKIFCIVHIYCKYFSSYNGLSLLSQLNDAVFRLPYFLSFFSSFLYLVCN